MVWQITKRPLVACLQIISGERDAYTITREEFEDFLAAAHKKVVEKIAEGGVRWEPLYSWDHTALHENINYERVGFSKQQRVQLGVRAPDMHKAIEHVFGYIKPRLHARLYQADYQATAVQCQNLAKQVFMETALANRIGRDVATLPLTYRVISTPKGQWFKDGKGKVHYGTGGDWPPATYR